jgi:hypothetical protein
MQQLTTSAEACALLDRVLQTVQTLNRALASLQPQVPSSAPQARPLPMVVRPVLPQLEDAVAPVLTIKLSDLMREGTAARERRQQHTRPQRPNRPRSKPLRPQLRDVEVIYRKSYRVAS